MEEAINSKDRHCLYAFFLRITRSIGNNLNHF